MALVGVTFEERHLARRLGLPRDAGGHGDGHLGLYTVGLGAAMLWSGPARLAAGARPDVVLSTGLAGGCAPDLRSGDVVVGSPVGSGAGGKWLVPPPPLVTRAVGALRVAGVPHRVGPLLTVTEAVATPAAKAERWRREGVLAVDMESALVLAWAAQAGIPALAVRAVSDAAADDLPGDLVGAVTTAGAVSVRGVLRLLSGPAGLGTAWRVWRRSRGALDRLAGFLAAFVASPASAESRS